MTASLACFLLLEAARDSCGVTTQILNQFSKQHLGITCVVIKCEWDVNMIKKYLSSTGSDVVAAAPHGILMLDRESLPLALFLIFFFLKDPEHSRHILIRRGENYMRKHGKQLSRFDRSSIWTKRT